MTMLQLRYAEEPADELDEQDEQGEQPDGTYLTLPCDDPEYWAQVVEVLQAGAVRVGRWR